MSQTAEQVATPVASPNSSEYASDTEHDIAQEAETLLEAIGAGQQVDPADEQRVMLTAMADLLQGFKSLKSKMNVMETSLGTVSQRVVNVENSVTGIGGNRGVLGTTPAPPHVTARNGGRSARYSLSHLPENTLNTTQTLVKEYVIPNDKILSCSETNPVTLRLIGWLYDNYQHYKTTSADKSKTLIMFIHKSVTKLMLEKESSLKSPLSTWITETKIYECTDEQTDLMLTNLVRPRSRNEYQTKFVEAVTKPDFSKAIKFDTEEWHDKIYPKISKTLRDIARYDDYLRRFATPEQLKIFPKYNWGKSKGREEGLFRMVFKFFAPHHEKILTLVGEEDVKKLTNLDELLQKIQKMNDDKNRQSEELMVRNEEMMEPLDTNELIAKSKARTLQEKLRKGHSDRKSSSKYPARLNLLGNGDTAKQQGSEDDDDHGFEAEFKALMGAGYASNNKKQYGKDRGLKHTSDAKKLPCYIHAVSGNCTAGKDCIYSHEHKDAQAFLERELRKVLFSPNYHDMIMTRAKAAGKIEPRPKRDKSLLVTKPSHSSPNRYGSHGDHKQLDGQTETSPKTEEKGPVNQDTYSTTSSEASPVVSDSETGSGSNEGSETD